MWLIFSAGSTRWVAEITIPFTKMYPILLDYNVENVIEQAFKFMRALWLGWYE